MSINVSISEEKKERSEEIFRAVPSEILRVKLNIPEVPFQVKK